MNDRLLSIIVEPKDTIRSAMMKIENGVRCVPPSPWGIALVVENEHLVGIATDGDIRRAILNGAQLDDAVETVITRNPLTVLHSESPDIVLARFYEEIRAKKLKESRFNHIITVDTDGKLVDVLTAFELWKRSEVKIKTVAVIGLGYVGLTLALTLCEFGIRVIGIDANPKVIDSLGKGVPHFFEKGLEPLLRKHIGKNLIVSCAIAEHESDIFIVCVGTPVDDKGAVNDTYLREATMQVGRILKPHDLVVLRSTVPIGTCRNIVMPILEKESGLRSATDFYVAFAPERTVEGKALEELKTLPQVIGGLNKQSFDYTVRLFRVFTHTIVAVENLEEAEAVKLLNNTFRDVSFAFSNEVSMAFAGHGLNARSIIRAANEGYTRNPIPSPSPGVGGPCLVKDPHIFLESARTAGYRAKLPLIAREINESMIDFIVAKVDAFCNLHAKDPATMKIFLMGMAFKGHPETSDLRHSTSVDILRKLKTSYDAICMYDAVAHRSEMETLGVAIAGTPEEGFRNADCVLVLNNYPGFRDLPIFELASSMKSPGMLFDPWGCYGTEQIQSLTQLSYTGL